MGGGLTASAEPPHPGGRPAAEDFYDRPVLAVAPDLLGATVWHGPVAVRITEVEAYAGLDDPASHAYRGPTPRAVVMFGPPGRAYVYLSYGIHWCLNVVCGPAGQGAAVLFRAGEVLAGRDLVAARYPRLVAVDLARGPGRLGRCLGISREMTGTPMTGGGPLTLVPRNGLLGPSARPADPVAGSLAGSLPEQAGEPLGAIRQGPRVGITRAVERPWRFWLADQPTVSSRRSTGRRK